MFCFFRGGAYRLLLSPVAAVLVLAGLLGEAFRVSAAALKGEGFEGLGFSSKWINERVLAPEEITDSFDSIKVS